MRITNLTLKFSYRTLVHLVFVKSYECTISAVTRVVWNLLGWRRLAPTFNIQQAQSIIIGYYIT